MKDHIIAAVVNDLRDTAIKFHDAQQLRERLRGCIEPLLSSAAPQVVADEADLECQIPPFGWRCTRGAGHDGPCAAVECPEDVAAVKRGMARLASAPVQAASVPFDREKFIKGIVLSVAEIPDRSSPEDQPEMMLVTGEELRGIIESQLELVVDDAVSVQASNPVEFDGIKNAPVQAQEPVGYINPAFLAERRSEFEQNGTVMFAWQCGECTSPIYRAPVQPMTVPDGVPFFYKKDRVEVRNPFGHIYSGVITKAETRWGADKRPYVIYQVRADGEKTSSQVVPSQIMTIAAPAAQGDAKGLTPSQITELAKQSGFSVDASGHIKVAALNGGCTAQVMRLAHAAIAAKAAS